MMKSTLIFFFASSFLVQGIIGEIICDDLPSYLCAFSVASSGKRCLLENYESGEGRVEYQCTTSEVIVERMSDHIETDDCINACGVDRMTTGISSDALHESHTSVKLCSADCYQNCPNIIDLYFNLAAGEGVYFPDLCEVQKFNPHRAMIELLSSGGGGGGFVAGPVSSEFPEHYSASAPAPSFY
jgi:hypothetical protein